MSACQHPTEQVSRRISGDLLCRGCDTVIGNDGGRLVVTTKLPDDPRGQVAAVLAALGETRPGAVDAVLAPIAAAIEAEMVKASESDEGAIVSIGVSGGLKTALKIVRGER